VPRTCEESLGWIGRKEVEVKDARLKGGKCGSSEMKMLFHLTPERLSNLSEGRNLDVMQNEKRKQRYGVK